MRTASITRVIAVPAKFIFLAYTKPEHLMRWFGAAGYPVTLCESDFRVGGAWRMAMTGPDGVQGLAFGGKYLEIMANGKIVSDNAFKFGSGGETNL